MDIDLLLIYLLMLILPVIASINVNRNYKKYKKEKVNSGKTGFEVAREILDKNGLSNIYIVESPGELTDCYDPKRKTVRLSTDVFHGNTIAAVSIAAHECGHAIQDKEEYAWMKFRSSLFPYVSVANRVAYITLILGFLFQVVDLVMLSIVLTSVSLVFQIITLPVEYDASNRAKIIMDELDIVNKDELSGASKVLGAAALTYVAGVLTTLLQMLYYLMMFRDRD